MPPLEPVASDLALTDEHPFARRVFRKVASRLIPFLCILYIFNILDRANVGFARSRMREDLGLEDWEFDLAYGLFYFGYLAFEVPSNLLMRRYGARRWIGRIMISWGIVSCATFAVVNGWSFSGVRILLGIAEAGFFPGIILYLTYWFPARERARVTAYFMAAIGFSGVFGNPLSGVIMYFCDGLGGLADWQWLFLLEGIPSVVLGLITLLWLTDRPMHAAWLTPDERDWLTRRMDHEEKDRVDKHGADHWRAMLNWRVWFLICLYFTVATGANAAGAYVPTLIGKQFPQVDELQRGLLTALPHVCAIIGMTIVSTSSDRTGERRVHVACAALLAACGWGLCAVSSSPAVVLLGFCLAQTGMMSMLPVFWTLPTAFLSGAAAAGGIALINSVGNIGGIVGPTILGQFGLWSMAGIMFAGSVMALFLRRDPDRKPLAA